MLTRRPPIHSLGTEPDPRFSYANERTFLPWNRTALALVAAALAATSLLPEFNVAGGRRLIGVPLILLSAVLAAVTYRRWDANERAMRLRQPLPPPHLGRILAAGVAVAALIAAVVALLGTDDRHVARMTSHETDSEHTRDDPEVPGLAGERTDLAWSRSALAVAVAAAALLRRVWETVDGDNGRVVVFTLLGVGALGWVAALGWARGAARTTLEGRQVANPIVLRRVAAGTLMFCVAALILAFIPSEG